MNSREITKELKGFAILGVVLCHSHQTFNLPGSLNEVFSFLQVGVQLFMILSAMGLCFSYDSSHPSLKEFYKKRIGKLLLPYWAAIIVAALYRVCYALITHKGHLSDIYIYI